MEEVAFNMKPDIKRNIWKKRVASRRKSKDYVPAREHTRCALGKKEPTVARVQWAESRCIRDRRLKDITPESSGPCEAFGGSNKGTPSSGHTASYPHTGFNKRNTAGFEPLLSCLLSILMQCATCRTVLGGPG